MGYWIQNEQEVVQMDGRPVYVVLGWTRNADEAILRSQVKRSATELKKAEMFWLDTMAVEMLTR
jgi:hypothetical protein